MKSVYAVKDTTELLHFICSFDDGNKVTLKGTVNTGANVTLEGVVSSDSKNTFSGVTEISPKAFLNAVGVKKVFFDGNLKTIKKEAFKDCEELEVFCCEEESDEETNQIKGVKIAGSGSENFIIETLAFSKCKNLHTVILPNCKELVIEKDAFSGCSSLRTVVCFSKSVVITGNPFEDCPETLTFVGGKIPENKPGEDKSGGLEKFARENGYRYVDV